MIILDVLGITIETIASSSSMWVLCTTSGLPTILSSGLFLQNIKYCAAVCAVSCLMSIWWWLAVTAVTCILHSFLCPFQNQSLIKFLTRLLLNVVSLAIEADWGVLPPYVNSEWANFANKVGQYVQFCYFLHWLWCREAVLPSLAVLALS